PGIFAPSANCRRPLGAARIHGSYRIDADHVHRPPGHLFDIAAAPAERASGTAPGHKMSHLTVGFLPDLRPGRLIVTLWAGHIEILVRFPRAGGFGHEPVRDTVVTIGMIRGNR